MASSRRTSSGATRNPTRLLLFTVLPTLLASRRTAPAHRGLAGLRSLHAGRSLLPRSPPSFQSGCATARFGGEAFRVHMPPHALTRGGSIGSRVTAAFTPTALLAARCGACPSRHVAPTVPPQPARASAPLVHRRFGTCPSRPPGLSGAPPPPTSARIPPLVGSSPRTSTFRAAAALPWRTSDRWQGTGPGFSLKTVAPAASPRLLAPRERYRHPPGFTGRVRVVASPAALRATRSAVVPMERYIGTRRSAS